MSLLGNDACVRTEFKLSFVKLSCNPEADGAGLLFCGRSTLRGGG